MSRTMSTIIERLDMPATIVPKCDISQFPTRRRPRPRARCRDWGTGNARGSGWVVPTEYASSLTASWEYPVMFNLTGLNYFMHFSSRLPQYFIMSVLIQSFHISTCKNYAY